MTWDNADTAVSVASLIGGFVWPPAVGAAKLAAQVLEPLRRRVPAVDALLQTLGADLRQTTGQNHDLHFLSRIQRVARLRRTIT